MIRKITKLKIAKTETQENDAWAEVLSLRNKLLSNSNWTQLPDSGLTEKNVQLWMEWRNSLRRVHRRNFGDKEVARKVIDRLAESEPRAVYEDEAIFLISDADIVAATSIKDRREYLIRLLDKKFNGIVDAQSFESNHVIVSEQFEEALIYNETKSLDSFPLISLHCELTGKTPDVVVSDFIALKRKRLRAIISLQRKYAFFRDGINAAEDVLHLQDIERDIKEWTLTLT